MLTLSIAAPALPVRRPTTNTRISKPIAEARVHVLDASKPKKEKAGEEESFSDYLRKDRHRCIVHMLNATPLRAANEYTLHHLLADFGHVLSLDRVRQDLRDMALAGTIVLNETPASMIASLPAGASGASA